MILTGKFSGKRKNNIELKRKAQLTYIGNELFYY